MNYLTYGWYYLTKNVFIIKLTPISGASFVNPQKSNREWASYIKKVCFLSLDWLNCKLFSFSKASGSINISKSIAFFILTQNHYFVLNS